MVKGGSKWVGAVVAVDIQVEGEWSRLPAKKGGIVAKVMITSN